MSPVCLQWRCSSFSSPLYVWNWTKCPNDNQEFLIMATTCSVWVVLSQLLCSIYHGTFEVHLLFIHPVKRKNGQSMTVISQLLMHWRYDSLSLSLQISYQECPQNLLIHALISMVVITYPHPNFCGYMVFIVSLPSHWKPFMYILFSGVYVARPSILNTYNHPRHPKD